MPYKNYQRLEIQAFGIAADSFLDLIYNQLSNQIYSPQPVYKVNIPKSEFSNRTLTLLSIPDWIVYTAIATLIAEAAIPKTKIIYQSVLFSSIPSVQKTGRSPYLLQRWQRHYKRYNETSKQYVNNGYPFLAEIDITSFYDLIVHDLLLEQIRKYFNDVYSLELLDRFLKSWSSIEGKGLFGHGIPQGPEASIFLADLFLYQLDEHMMNIPGAKTYLRYVDDIRIFSKNERRAEAGVVHLEQEIKRLGLVPNTSKVRVTDARKNLDWLKEESSDLLADQFSRVVSNNVKADQRRRHLRFKRIFLKNCVKGNIDQKNTYLTRVALPRLLPDQEVIERIQDVYNEKHTLYDLFFNYLKECKNNSRLSQFCWRQLRRVPVRDWECSNLMEVAVKSGTTILSSKHGEVLLKYKNHTPFPLSSSMAGSILLGSETIPSFAYSVRNLPNGSVYLNSWFVTLIHGNKRRKPSRSLLAIIKNLLKCNDPRTTFIVSYLVFTKFSVSVLASLPSPKSELSFYLLKTLGANVLNTTTDEIASLLSRLFRVTTPSGFNFRIKLNSLSPNLYERALRHLQIASYYVDTSPTYFINHIHNFNHVLLHFVLHNSGFTNAPVKWKNTFGQLRTGANPALLSGFPTMTKVFLLCSQDRNTNLSSHPYDDIHSRFSRLITYKERNRIISLLRAAYKEFISKA